VPGLGPRYSFSPCSPVPPPHLTAHGNFSAGGLCFCVCCFLDSGTSSVARPSNCPCRRPRQRFPQHGQPAKRWRCEGHVQRKRQIRCRPWPLTDMGVDTTGPEREERRDAGPLLVTNCGELISTRGLLPVPHLCLMSPPSPYATAVASARSLFQRRTRANYSKTSPSLSSRALSPPAMRAGYWVSWISYIRTLSIPAGDVVLLPRL
jgi:hypothetical protein